MNKRTSGRATESRRKDQPRRGASAGGVVG